MTLRSAQAQYRAHTDAGPAWRALTRGRALTLTGVLAALGVAGCDSRQQQRPFDLPDRVGIVLPAGSRVVSWPDGTPLDATAAPAGGGSFLIGLASGTLFGVTYYRISFANDQARRGVLYHPLFASLPPGVKAPGHGADQESGALLLPHGSASFEYLTTGDVVWFSRNGLDDETGAATPAPR